MIPTTSGPRTTSFRSMLFCYNTGKMLKKLNSCLYQLAYGKTDFINVISLEAVKTIDNVKWGFTVL